MPRISPTLIRQAHRISPNAAILLPATRDLLSALNELRWIREHVQQQIRANSRLPVALVPYAESYQVAALCRRRGRGEPLQYVLGTQPFGPLELKCRPGVLIPRSEPEAYSMYLASLLLGQIAEGETISSLRDLKHTNSSKPLRILDLCTGTGCIPLLLYTLLHRTIPNLQVQGIDISPAAVQLSKENARHNKLPLNHKLTFAKGDIFAPAVLDNLTSCDILTCNPPYISPWGFAHQTARSVRNYEPKLAQVPAIADYTAPHHTGWIEDVFYARLLDIAVRLKPRVMLFEVGDLKQALRVVGMAFRHDGLWEKGDGMVEVWRDWPDAAPGEDEETIAQVDGGSLGVKKVRIRGSGHGRSVLIKCR